MQSNRYRISYLNSCFLNPTRIAMVLEMKRKQYNTFVETNGS